MEVYDGEIIKSYAHLRYFSTGGEHEKKIVTNLMIIKISGI